MSKAKSVYFEPETLQEAQEMLESGKTKKSICEYLGIAYNTKKLGSILENYEQERLREKAIRKEKRKTACTQEELVSMVEDYLNGMSFKDLASCYYRSTTYIKHRMSMIGALVRSNASASPLDAPIFPDEGMNFDADFVPRVEKLYKLSTRKDWDAEVKAMRDQPEWATARELFNSGSKFASSQKLRIDGECVWVPGYQCLGEVIKEVPSKGDRAFRVLLLDEGLQRNVHLPFWDMCSLRHLTEMGVNLTQITTYMKNDDVTSALNVALRAAKAIKEKK